MVFFAWFFSGYGSMKEESAERTVRGRVEPRSASQHRRLERLFGAAPEARNAIIADSRSARAWNLLEIRRRKRQDAEWKPGADDWFDWAGKDGVLEAGKLARAEASRMARSVAKGGKKPLRFRGWRERRSMEWDRLPSIAFAEGSMRHGKLRGKVRELALPVVRGPAGGRRDALRGAHSAWSNADPVVERG